MAQTLNTEIIEAAIAGFELKRNQIDEQIGELRAMLSSSPADAAVARNGGQGRRKMSAAGRARIAAAQKARWAKIRGETEPAQAAPAKPTRKLSAAGRRNIIAALKKRWAAKRAEGAAKSKPAPGKKATPARKATARKGTRPVKTTNRTPAKTQAGAASVTA